MSMFSFLQSVILTVLLAFVLRFFVLQPYIVEGASMEPSFRNNQYIIIDKLSYRLRAPQRGEVVVLHPPVEPNENYIKRIVALPGETIELKEGNVFINGTELQETYLGDENHNTEEVSLPSKVTLGADEYFVLGDNRSHSSDSREWGSIHKSAMEGRTWFIALPFSDFTLIQRPTYNVTLSLQEWTHAAFAQSSL